MPAHRVPINDFLQLSTGKLILDVRSPAEYNHAHIPGAISFPLFTDEERKVVGTTYKQQSRENAIKVGLDYFGPKMRTMVEQAEKLAREQYSGSGRLETFVYCWRGGMRSAGVAWLLDLYGFKVVTLAGGYKAFRNEVLQTFQRQFSFQVLGGYTGSGKTQLINSLSHRGQFAIDLERLAAHKGSAFGKHKMPPSPSQEMFENLLAMELRRFCNENKKSNEIIWLEDESQRIGNINIPGGIWEQMRSAPLFFLDIPFEERLQNILNEYGDCPVDTLKEAVVRIRKRLGGLDTKNTLQFLEEGNIKEAFRILLNYYDKLYLKGLHNRQNLPDQLIRLNTGKITEENVHLLPVQIRL